jgi:MoaA/NifB/PqqE/SkfB family radical SAM enzyme
METHERFDVEPRGQVVVPGPISRALRPLIARVRARIPDAWIGNWVYGPLSRQARRRVRDDWERLLPTTVSLETRTICNGRCAFCAASVQNRAREDRAMPWEVFTGVIDDLVRVNWTGRLAFFVNNEPLLDQGLEDKVAYARSRLPRAFFQLSSNGLILSPARANALFDAGLDDLLVNDYVAHWREVRENIAAALAALSPKRKRKFIVYQRDQRMTMFNRAGTAPNKEVAPRPLRAFCQMPFTQINIVYDGTVSLCCMDLLVQTPIGNAAEQGVWNVWFSERYREIRRRLLALDRRATSLCAVCDYRGFKTLTGVLRPFNRLFNVLK